MNFRKANFNDLHALIAIYNQAVEAGNATADQEAVDPTTRKAWLEDHVDSDYPIFILENEQNMIGWASLSPYRKGRKALRETAEISYYLDYRYHGQGYGKKLLRYVMDVCPKLGIYYLFALLLEVNTTSVTILEQFGFERWGYMPEVANLNGQRCAHLIYGRKL